MHAGGASTASDADDVALLRSHSLVHTGEVQLECKNRYLQVAIDEMRQLFVCLLSTNGMQAAITAVQVTVMISHSLVYFSHLLSLQPNDCFCRCGEFIQCLLQVGHLRARLFCIIRLSLNAKTTTFYYKTVVLLV